MGTCEKCHTSCKECTGYGENKCSDCFEKFSLGSLFDCFEVECLDTEYFDAFQYSCRSCHYSCATCTGWRRNECLSCDKFKGLVLSSQDACEKCPVGFRFDFSTFSCEEICGDGLNFGSHECDDRNLVEGDGCSDECEVENTWNCTRVDENTPDECWSLIGPVCEIS